MKYGLTIFLALSFGFAGGLLSQTINAHNLSAFKLSTVATSTLPIALGVATSSPSARLEVYNSATSSLRIDSDASTKGGCIIVKNVTGSGYTYVYASGGALTASSVSCL